MDPAPAVELRGDAVEDVVETLRRAGVGRGELLAVAVDPAVGVGLATADGRFALTPFDAATLRAIDATLRPRWVMWSVATARQLVRQQVRVATSWDLAAVQRLLDGGWWDAPGPIWAQLHGLPLGEVPELVPVDLFTQAAAAARDPEQAVGPDGHLDPAWAAGEWRGSVRRLATWARLAQRLAVRQQQLLAVLPGDTARYLGTARAESTTELLCAELGVDGLPVDRVEAERLIAAAAGPRPADEVDAAAIRTARDRLVTQHVPGAEHADLRSPGQVKSLLRRAGIEVADTRAWRLEPLRDQHAVIDALLVWRKAERIATTYGYTWLDHDVTPAGRLRGTWASADGAAGRMTASAGLHNLPAELRPAVVAEPGHVFVRADLGQIEPRVLATVSGDPALIRATLEDDMYQPIATRLAVDRATAKVAVLGAMYGQTTGHGATALRGLRSNYPVAMELLEAADRVGQVGGELRTHGGRRIPMGSLNVDGVADRDARSRAAAQGRYARNAMVQGAAAELFKMWAVTVRARGAAMDAQVVLCLHDELLVHVPVARAEESAQLVADALQETARRWRVPYETRFTADIRIIERWSDAK